MKPLIKTFLFFFICNRYGLAQDSVVTLSTTMFDKQTWVLRLSPMKGWLFKEGNSRSWADKDIALDGWKEMNPMKLSAKYADKTRRAEGWFRFKFKLDSSFRNLPIGFLRGCWAATDLYLDGNFLASFGNTGDNGGTYEEYNPIDKLSISADVRPGTEHLLAIHFVDYLAPLPPGQLKSETAGGTRSETNGLRSFIGIVGHDFDSKFADFSRATLFYRSIWAAVTTLLAILFWLLVFQNPREKKILMLIAFYASFAAFSNLTRFPLTNPSISFNTYQVNDLLQKFCFWMGFPATVLIATTALNFRRSRNFRRIFIIYSGLGLLTIFFNFGTPFLYLNTFIVSLIVAYIVASSRKKIKGAQWPIIGGLLLSMFFIVLLTTLAASYSTRLSLLTCYYFSFPVSLVVYVSIRFREIIREVEENAGRVVQMTKEREADAIKQQKILEEEVDRQTAELRTTLSNLRSTQTQLIQSEKMASLGELTAGIAHEIQNPLNFVNNFSDVNNELVDELKSELAVGNMQSAVEIAESIKENSQKINHHGKRADAIVKGMLQHSRTSSGQKQLTDINGLCDEYMRLAYHGFRAKDKSFNAEIKTDLDSNIVKISIVPQDIGRVLLNLINNAFYAVNEKAKHRGDEYGPTVTITTRSIQPPLGGPGVKIKVIDNGGGIPQNIVGKIFQPFFTTKPTGQGTGLGLSLAYDIVKAHGGEIKVETKEEKGTTFIVQLPA